MKIFFYLSLIVLIGCQSTAEKKMIHLKVNHQLINCELAQSQEQLARGLMYRTKLAKNQGMLFIFPQEYPWPFWMKNTLIPLDIIWMDKNKNIVHLMRNLTPCSKGSNQCPSFSPPSSVKSKYVLELNSGQIDVLGLKLKHRLDFSIEQ